MATKKVSRKVSQSAQITQLMPSMDWVAVWFDIDKHGEIKRGSVLTSPLVCWALTDQGVVGVVAATPSDEAVGTYLPELVDENFRGYNPPGADLNDFLNEWDAELEAADDDEDEEEEEDDDDEDDDG